MSRNQMIRLVRIPLLLVGSIYLCVEDIHTEYEAFEITVEDFKIFYSTISDNEIDIQTEKLKIKSVQLKL